MDRIRLGILRSFVDLVREVVSEEFGLGLLVRVEGLTAEGIVGTVDFADDRRIALARVEGLVSRSFGRLPKAFQAGPVLDRLLVCTEIVRAPDRLDSKLGDLRRECVARFRNDGMISAAIKSANPDGTSDYDLFAFAAPVGFAPK